MAPFLAERPAPYRPENWRKGERKLVTVLFADIRGSLQLIQALDVEQAQHLLDEVTTRLAAAVHRYGGTVCQVLGDGIMALFGAPCALEDHADRACLAALDMVEDIHELRVDGIDAGAVALRIGICSDEVVVRAIVSDLVSHYSAVGTAVHVASRLQQMATPGIPRLAAKTRRMLVRGFELESLGPRPVAGLAEPLELFDLIGPEPPGEPGGSLRNRSEATPLVGRTREMAVLLAEAERALNRRGRLVFVQGEPGMGKSRLARELLAQEPLRGWRRGVAAPALGLPAPWQLLARLLGSLLGVSAGRDADATCRALTESLTRLDESLKALAVPLTACFGLAPDAASWSELDPRQRRERIRQSLLTLLRRLSIENPVVLVAEDLHEADHETLAFLELLAQEIGSMRLLVVATARPPLTPAWLGKPDVLTLRLEPLSTASAAGLLEALLGAAAVGAPLRAELIRRAGGNPFFLEELARAVAASPGDDGSRQGLDVAALPGSVQVVLNARIDRLPWGQRILLRAASVLGELIDLDLLRELDPEAGDELVPWLEALCAAGFLAFDPGAGCYRFRHTLTREAAYSGLLRRQRIELHRRVVRKLEEEDERARDAGALARIAYHAFFAELWERAFDAYRDLAERALARSAVADALFACGRADMALRQLDPTGPSSRLVDLRLLQAEAHFAAGDHAAVAPRVEEARIAAVRLNDQRRVVRALSMSTLAHWARGDLAASVTIGREALATATVLGDFELRVNTAFRLATFLIARGEYEASVGPLEWVIDAIPADGGHERFGLTMVAGVAARAALARALAELDMPERVLLLSDEAMAMAAAIGHGFTTIFAAQEIGLAFLRLDDPDRAALALEPGYALCREAPSHILFPATAAELGYARVLQGERGTGFRLLEAAVAADEQNRLDSQRGQRIGFLAAACLIGGDAERAERLAERALALARRHGERGDEGWLLLLRAAVALHGDAAAAAAASYLSEARDLAEELGMRRLLCRCDAARSRRHDGVTAGGPAGGAPRDLWEFSQTGTAIAGSVLAGGLAGAGTAAGLVQKGRSS
ncbi:ATP-binding protein [Benzoatithermus flavus]|uniref:Adenylate/guanylate cyclase domain-containing protein n=1 Tax=Benzoatithermus flavus TaxID=3108223 RepID=A0ABU8XQD5_9PROT